MIKLRIFTLFFLSIQSTLIAHSRIKDQASVQMFHERMTNEFTSRITFTLNQASSVIASFDYTLDDPKYQLDWTHGSLPILKLSFFVKRESTHVCRFDFQVECFWEHLQEALKEIDDNSKQFHEQVQICNHNIEELINGPTGSKGIVEAISSLN